MGSNVPYDALDPNCPSRLVLSRIGEKWTLFVLLALGQRGVRRFTELRHDVGLITPKVLTETLRALERDGLVSRETFAEMPPRVEYRLTRLGESLLSAIQVMRSWSEENAGHIVAAREKADAVA